MLKGVDMRRLFLSLFLLIAAGNAHAAFADYRQWVNVGQSGVTGSSQFFVLDGQRFERFDLTITPATWSGDPFVGFTLYAALREHTFLTDLHLSAFNVVSKIDANATFGPAYLRMNSQVQHLDPSYHTIYTEQPSLTEGWVQEGYLERFVEFYPMQLNNTFEGQFPREMYWVYSSVYTFQPDSYTNLEYSMPQLQLSFVVDPAFVQPVPEPETYALLGMGLLAGGLARRARRRRSQNISQGKGELQ
ncbi:PEP-CTERM sorting domain-containing protein [Chitinolyticbacter meiyuanensis]|uniref:PEP-CTERM sorting domain-containing protein n=1 Tax=Chitinolyticbacter meiyuanensis TaxID=682798 RepID=UPI0011E5A2A4|nr:PEP-CTERM sorting domain-containing protein [Chitinolyticbacter meiyuanensis]